MVIKAGARAADAVLAASRMEATAKTATAASTWRGRDSVGEGRVLNGFIGNPVLFGMFVYGDDAGGPIVRIFTTEEGNCTDFRGTAGGTAWTSFVH